MKKKVKQERTPARILSKEELETGVLAAGCCYQGCCGGNAIYLSPILRLTQPILRYSLITKTLFRG